MLAVAEKVISDVAQLAGESLTLLCEPSDTGLPGLGALITQLAETELRSLFLSLPSSELCGWKNLSGGLQEETIGSSLLLPDDFLRLGELRLSGWERSVTVIKYTESLEYVLCGRRLRGPAPSRHRPAAFLVPSPQGRKLLLYPAGGSDVISAGYYLPQPSLTGAGVEILPEVYDRLISNVASHISPGPTVLATIR